jgi:N-acetylmuramoyl-L-alanine amidase
MDKNNLYKIRWYVNQRLSGKKEDLDAVLRLLAIELGEQADEPSLPPDNLPELPDPDSKSKLRLVLIVGHEKKAPGADLKVDGKVVGHEYGYNTEIASKVTQIAKNDGRLEVHTIFRDGIGIGGAYREARELTPDCLIELHFNAFNGTASGTETLTTPDALDRTFAGFVQKEVCEVFGRTGLSRGVKILSRSDRGGGNIHSAPATANCLVEPFFGDNHIDASLALARKDLYAQGLVDACIMWAKSVGMSV